jgi:integrase
VRKTLTDRAIAALKPSAKAYGEGDPDLAGHYVRVWPSGKKTFCAVARNPSGKQVWTTIGESGALTVAQSRERARGIIQRVRDGLPAIEPRSESFGAVAAAWLKRHVEGNGLISAKEINRLLDANVLPSWKDREFTSIRRSDISSLLDEIEDGVSQRQADACLTIIRSIMNWFATRHDDYNPPIVKGMKRQKTAGRTRVLDDGELRAIWRAAEDQGGAFAGIVRLCLLTAQRSRKVAKMRWEDLDLDAGVWTVAQESAREKGAGGALALPDAALSIIRAQPRLATNPHVFPARGGAGPFVGFGSAKEAFDAKLPEGTPGWTVHDLRRTSRSLMSRAGVSSDHAERVLGHAIGGVEAIYDRHAYFDEKRVALAKLATLIDSIVNPRDNVVPLTPKGVVESGR